MELCIAGAKVFVLCRLIDCGMLSSTGVIGVCDCFSCWVVCITIAAAAVAAAAVLLTSQVPFTITPGSEQIRATIARDGLMDVFTKVRWCLRYVCVFGGPECRTEGDEDGSGCVSHLLVS